jgi:hypothetical protein
MLLGALSAPAGPRCQWPDGAAGAPRHMTGEVRKVPRVGNRGTHGRQAATLRNLPLRRGSINRRTGRVDRNSLAYLHARYLNSQQGQFLSENPVSLAVGNPAQVQQLSTQDREKFLSDPQQLNSYAYGRDNPITTKDPSQLSAHSHCSPSLQSCSTCNGLRH